MRKTSHDRRMDALLRRVRARARAKARSPATTRRLAWHARRGTSQWVCAEFAKRCLNMGSDEGRECNASIHGDPCDCPSRVRRPRRAPSRLDRQNAALNRIIETAAGRKRLIRVLLKPVRECTDPAMARRIAADLGRALSRSVCNAMAGRLLYSTCRAGERPRKK